MRPTRSRGASERLTKFKRCEAAESLRHLACLQDRLAHKRCSRRLRQEADDAARRHRDEDNQKHADDHQVDGRRDRHRRHLLQGAEQKRADAPGRSRSVVPPISGMAIVFTAMARLKAVCGSTYVMK